MKRLLASIFAIALIGVVFNSCKKDDETVLDNSITIEGEFTVGDKTYTNPSFDLGEADNHHGYLAYYDKSGVEYNIIIIENENEISLGDGNEINYELHLNSATTEANVGMYARIGFYPMVSEKQGYVILYGDNAKANITKIGEVGGYIEGAYEGDFSLPNKAAGAYHIKGKFKVKRVPEIVK